MSKALWEEKEVALKITSYGRTVLGSNTGICWVAKTPACFRPSYLFPFHDVTGICFPLKQGV